MDQANQQSPSIEEDGFILLTDLRPIVPLHPQHIRKMARQGLFPAPIKILGRTAFRRREVRIWLADPNAYRPGGSTERARLVDKSTE